MSNVDEEIGTSRFTIKDRVVRMCQIACHSRREDGYHTFLLITTDGLSDAPIYGVVRLATFPERSQLSIALGLARFFFKRSAAWDEYGQMVFSPETPPSRGYTFGELIDRILYKHGVKQ